MTTAKKRGFAGRVYYNSGTHGSPTWVDVTEAVGIKIGDSWSTFDASDRSSSVKKFLPSMCEWTMEFDVLWDSSSTTLLAIRTAYRANTAVNFWFADGPSATVGSSGPNAEWLITEFGTDAPLADGYKITIKCVPHANCSFEPEYKVIS